MIIVSQNKNAIYNFSNVNCIMTRNVEEKCKIMLFDNTYSAEIGDGDRIGIYETEERAKEVLEEIIEQYEHEKDCKCDRSYLETLDNFTYRMPKE